MKRRWKFGVIALSLVTLAAAIVFGVVFGLKRTGDNGRDTPVIFTVSFYVGEGDPFPPFTGEAGSAIVFPVPERAGYQFEGWFADADLTLPAPPLVPQGGAIYYAKFAKLYTVRFVMGDEAVSFTGTAGKEIAVPNPEKTDFEFDGWYSDETFLREVYPPSAIAGDAVYYAKFVPLFTVSFQAEGFDIPPVTGRAGAPLSLPSPQKDSFRFEGWYLDPEYTRPVRENTIPHGNAVYYAKFTTLFTVRFISDAGEISSVTGAAGEPLVLPDTAREGYVFEGWETENGAAAQIPATIPARNATFVAKYAKLYTVEFDTDGGTEIPAVTAKAGTALDVSEPKKGGYAFVGWYADPERTRPTAVSEVPSADTVYYAKFEKLYSVVFEADGERIAETVGIRGTPVAAPSEVPKKAGYTFLGWKDGDGNAVSFPCAIGEGDVVYRAEYGENPVLRYDPNPPYGLQAIGTVPSVEGICGASVTVTVTDKQYALLGYRFAGWATSAGGGVTFRGGEEFVLSQSVTLYAVWMRGHVNGQVPDAVVYYSDACEEVVLLRNGAEQTGAVKRNVLGEAEFEIGGLAGRFNKDGTFTLRDSVYGTYAIDGGGELFLSGYATARFLNGGNSDTGIYRVSMGNLLYFEGGSHAGTYRIDEKAFRAHYMDNRAVFGNYFSADFVLLRLGEQATLGNRTGLYVADGNRISFYFGGEETQAEYDPVGKYLIYEGVIYYETAGEVRFVGDGYTLCVTPNGAYPVSAMLADGSGTVFAGELNVDGSDPSAFYFLKSEENGDFRADLRLTYGGRIGGLEILRIQRRAVWKSESQSDYSDTLRFTETAEEGRVERFVEGEFFSVLNNGVPLLIPKTETEAWEPESLVFELSHGGVDYRLLCTSDDASRRSFRLGWYGVRSGEASSGGFRARFRQYAGGYGIAEYEGMNFGNVLSFALYAEETELDAAYSFTAADGCALFHVFDGAYRGQYCVKLVRDGENMIAGMDCNFLEIAVCGDYVLSYERESGEYRFVRTVSLSEARELPLLSQEQIGQDTVFLKYAFPSDGCAGFLFGLEDGTLTEAAVRVFSENGDLISVLTDAVGERAYRVTITTAGNEPREAAYADGSWRIEEDYRIVSVVFAEAHTRAEIRRIPKIFTAFGSHTEGDVCIRYTLCGAEEAESIVSVTLNGEELAVSDFTPTRGEGMPDGHLVSAADERDGREYVFLLRPSSVSGSVEPVSRYEAELEDCCFTVLYGDGWDCLLPQIRVYYGLLGGETVIDGVVERREEGLYEWRAADNKLQNAVVTVRVERRSNLLDPLIVTADNLPLTASATDENGTVAAEAILLRNADGSFTVLSFCDRDGTRSGSDRVTSLGDAWYLAAYGYLLSREEEKYVLVKCAAPVACSNGIFTVSLVAADFRVLPVAFFVNGEEKTGGAFSEREGDVWVWEKGGEKFTLAFSETDGGYSVWVYEGERTLYTVTLKTGVGAPTVLYAPQGSFVLPDPPEREGYSFLCWTAGYGEYRAGETYELNRNVTFTAEWDEFSRIAHRSAISSSVMSRESGNMFESAEKV